MILQLKMDLQIILTVICVMFSLFVYWNLQKFALNIGAQLRDAQLRDAQLRDAQDVNVCTTAASDYDSLSEDDVKEIIHEETDIMLTQYEKRLDAILKSVSTIDPSPTVPRVKTPQRPGSLPVSVIDSIKAFAGDIYSSEEEAVLDNELYDAVICDTAVNDVADTDDIVVESGEKPGEFGKEGDDDFTIETPADSDVLCDISELFPVDNITGFDECPIFTPDIQLESDDYSSPAPDASAVVVDSIKPVIETIQETVDDAPSTTSPSLDAGSEDDKITKVFNEKPRRSLRGKRGAVV
jgi:hypothetical protein